MESAPGAPTHRPAAEVADAFAEWLSERSEEGRPFYAQVGFFETHTPYDFGGVAPDDSKGLWMPDDMVDDAEGRAWIAGLQGAVRELDKQVGRVLDALDERGLRGNTIVVFCADHGLEVPRGKWTLYDKGVEITFLARWPDGGVAGGAGYDGLYSQIDFAPTLYDWLGLPPDPAWRGASHAASLRGEAAEPRHAVYMSFQGDLVGRAARTKTRKVIQNFAEARCFRDPGPAGTKAKGRETLPFVECYDLVDDPLERASRDMDAPENAAYRALHGKLAAWMRDVGDPLIEGPAPTPYYVASRRRLPDAGQDAADAT